MNTEKVVGYILLTVGIIIIVFSAVNIYFVFTGRAQPVELFHSEGISLDLGSLAGAPVATKKTELVTATDINLISNLTIQVILMGFLAGTGQKLASLGVQLLRPIVVKAKNDKTTSPDS